MALNRCLWTQQLTRSLNICVLRRRLTHGWHGVPVPGVQRSFSVLLSRDRWIRLQGQVDALKAVTSGQWLKDMTFFESWLEAIATLIVYMSIVLAGNATRLCKILLMALLLASAGSLGTSNQQTQHFHMHGHVIRLVGKPNHTLAA